MKKKFNRNTFFTLLLIFPLTIFSKFYQFLFLSEKSFTDSTYILRLMSNNIEKKGTAFYVTAELFNKINFFHFTTLLEWSIFFAVIFSFVLFFLLLRYDKYNISEYAFIMSSIALLNFFVFNLSKDIIQLVVFLIIYFIINCNMRDSKKNIFIFLIFILEAVFFRPYYILIAYGFILSYITLIKYFKEEKLNRNQVLKILIIFLFLFLLPIGLTGKFYPTGYNQIINVRDDVTSVLQANTEINNLLQGNNYIIFCLNYVINGFRIFLPLELLFKSIKYLPFVAYQLYLTIVILNSLKLKNKKNIIILSIIVGYFLGSIIYEPDFGSVVRHETTLFMLFVLLNKNNLEVSDEM